MKCWGAKVVCSEEVFLVAMTGSEAETLTNSRLSLSNGHPLQRCKSLEKGFSFLLYKLWAARTHVGYGWCKLWQSSIESGWLFTTPAALSTSLHLVYSLSLLNYLGFSTHVYVKRHNQFIDSFHRHTFFYFFFLHCTATTDCVPQSFRKSQLLSLWLKVCQCAQPSITTSH